MDKELSDALQETLDGLVRQGDLQAVGLSEVHEAAMLTAIAEMFGEGIEQPVIVVYRTLEK